MELDLLLFVRRLSVKKYKLVMFLPLINMHALTKTRSPTDFTALQSKVKVVPSLQTP